MRKAISLLLVTLLVLTSGIAAFAADVTVPSDVKGTKYETAVTDLMKKIGLAGYTDGTFRPENAINRAEVCTILVKGLQPSDADLKAASDVFNDMTASDIKWALEYVNYGASKGIVKGYDGGQFRPSNNVTYNEMATMLVNALGYTDKDLTGTWPESHVSKAKELGVFKNVDITGKGDSAATRGDVALMTAAVVDKIIEQGKKPSDGTDNPSTSGGAVTPPATTPSATIPGDNNDPAFKDAGGAFGMVNGVSKVSDGSGNSVDQIEFLMGDKTYNLTANKNNILSDVKYDGSLYYIKFNVNKEIRGVYDNPADANVKHYAVLAGKDGWTDVTDRSKSVVTVSGGSEVSIMRDAVFYKATFDGDSIDGYESASLSDIEEGSKIRAYDVSDDSSAVADVVVIVTKSDAEKHGANL